MASDAADERRLPDLEDLRAKADQVHELVLNDWVREAFRQVGRSLWGKLKSWWEATYAREAARKPFDERAFDCLREQRRCTARMGKLRKQGLQTSAEYRRLEKAERRWIAEKARADEEGDKAEAKLQDPAPYPMDWPALSLVSRLAPNKRDLMEHMSPDSDPAMTEETVRLRSYALLTIVHDYALKGEVAPIASDDIWPQEDEVVPEDFAITIWKNMERYPSSWCGAIDRALRVVQADLAGAGQPVREFVVRLENIRADLDAVEQAPSEAGAGTEKGAEDNIPHIDLSQWKTSGSRKLMHDLLDDELREGVSVKPRRHGKNQPKELRRVLREETHHLPDVASAIKAVPGKVKTYKLDIPRERITFTAPKT